MNKVTAMINRKLTYIYLLFQRNKSYDPTRGSYKQNLDSSSIHQFHSFNPFEIYNPSIASYREIPRIAQLFSPRLKFRQMELKREKEREKKKQSRRDHWRSFSIKGGGLRNERHQNQRNFSRAPLINERKCIFSLRRTSGSCDKQTNMKGEKEGERGRREKTMKGIREKGKETMIVNN